METLQFHPDAVRWWLSLLKIAPHVGACHRWLAKDHRPIMTQESLEQHGTDTLVLCLEGTARIIGASQRCDLAPGESLIIRPGAWHRHAPMRKGSLVYCQGIFVGRSDFYLENHERRIVAAWPEHPARSMLKGIGDEDDRDKRRDLLAELLGHLSGQSVAPLSSSHPSFFAMEFALWQNLHVSDTAQRIVLASGLSRAQAYRVFREQRGVGIATAVRKSRIELGRALLAEGISVAEAAQRCGLEGRGAFARASKKFS